MSDTNEQQPLPSEAEVFAFVGLPYAFPEER